MIALWVVQAPEAAGQGLEDIVPLVDLLLDALGVAFEGEERLHDDA